MVHRGVGHFVGDDDEKADVGGCFGEKGRKASRKRARTRSPLTGFPLSVQLAATRHRRLLYGLGLQLTAKGGSR